MKIFTKLGLNAMVAFALMFAMTLSAVAQEKTTTSIDNTEVVKFTEANVLNQTMTALNATGMKYNNNKFGFAKGVKKGYAIPSVNDPDVYFRFIGDPGEEHDPTKWEETTDQGECLIGDEACVVLVRAEFVDHDASPKVIIASSLPGGEMPVIPTTGLNQVPDPNAAGTGSSQPYASASEIYNKN